MSPGPIDRSVLADRIDIVRRMLDGARALPLSDLDAFTSDARTPAAAESFLRRALEALLDAGRHVLARGFGRAPAEYAEVARQLGELGVVHQPLADRFVLMARYRNRMVHFYDEVTTLRRTRSPRQSRRSRRVRHSGAPRRGNGGGAVGSGDG